MLSIFVQDGWKIRQKVWKGKACWKNGVKKQNICWMEDEDGLVELDFLKDIEAWKYVDEANKVRFSYILENDDGADTLENDGGANTLKNYIGTKKDLHK